MKSIRVLAAPFRRRKTAAHSWQPPERFPFSPSSRCHSSARPILSPVNRCPNAFFSHDKQENLYSSSGQAQTDLRYAIQMVRSYDPAGYLPGRLLPTTQMQWTYYTVRSFWVETGLRIGTTALVSSTATPEEQLEWWAQGIESIYSGNGENEIKHPTLRLLQHLKYVPVGQDGKDAKSILPVLSKCHFEDILKGRREDLSIKQYATLDQLEEHAIWSCGSLSQLVLEADGIFETQYAVPHQAAKLVGRAHGLTNALRLSIPIVSATGKLIIPQDLCDKYGVKSPRYLLSALGQGDEKCTRALRLTVEEIASRARQYLQEARDLRPQLFEPGTTNRGNIGEHTAPVLLPALTAETFLNRLESHNFDLTDKSLRSVNLIEHSKCSFKLLRAWWQKMY